MVANQAVAVGRAVKTKQVNLTASIKILRTRADFDSFMDAEKPNTAVEHLEELQALEAYVLRGQVSSINKTKHSADAVRTRIVVPPTVLHKDDTIEDLGFVIPKQYIRFMQNRQSQTGVRLSETASLHYSVYNQDFEFVESFNARCPETPLTLAEFCVLMDSFEKGAAKFPREKTFSYEIALMGARENGNAVPAHVVREVHAYWLRRQAEHALPLIRHLWPVTLMWESSAFPVFRPRTKDKMLLRRPRRTKVESILRLFRIIDGFRKVIKLLTKMRQRDEKKLMVAQLEVVLFDQRYREREDDSYVCPFWRSILDNKRSRALKKLRGESSKSDNTVEPLSTSVRRLRNLQMSGCHWSSGPLDECISGNECYRNLRISRRIGRGGRIWIDRRPLYDRQPLPNRVYKRKFSFLSDDESGEDTECEFVNIPNQTGNFNVYTNGRHLERHPGFACNFESTHPYNTGGLAHYQLPEYLARQLEIIKLLEGVSPGRGDSTLRRFRTLTNYEGCT
ncbi:enhancer of polycomb-like family protein [Babesia caballi]|uniref:Enhancer of polycomb-like family protein n=1 Tax=Babesia caballi TaxID=5871 RepID=A0AAV4LTV0_BABCB|nr:enhancer of polycomb-like family protein [Babesia caballi]